MQIESTCMQCLVEDQLPNFSSITRVQIPDDGVIEAMCNRGHKTFTIIQEMKFEILSEMAIKAIVDGYYRDAVASFAGALERLHEFFIEATCKKHNIDVQIFKEAWKQMSNQSERQLGAFIIAHLIETRRSPNLIDQEKTGFRNGVIHKGKFPTRKETILFGEAVMACALPVLQLLKSEPYSEAVHALVGKKNRDRSKRSQEAGLQSAILSMNTFLSLTRHEVQADVEAAVAHYAARPVELQ